MKKIIHLSDLHIGFGDCEEKFDKIVTSINSLSQLEELIVVITGDIIDNANDENNWERAKTLIGKFIMDRIKVLVIPGNHDYGSGMKADTQYVEKFKRTFYRNNPINYPKVDIDDGIVFIGLDSNEDELHCLDRYFAEGDLGKEQLESLEKILNKPEFSEMKKVLYFHHHPIDYFFFMQLKDRRKLKRIVRNRVDVMLFGHNHNNYKRIFFRNLNGKWGITRVYNAGSSTHIQGHLGVQRLIDLSQVPPDDRDLNLILP